MNILLHEANGLQIGQRREDGYINLTKMAQASAKKLNDYLRLDTTKSFVEELSMDAGIPVSNLIQIRKGKPTYLQGTWGHPQVAVNCGQWCSPKFAVLVSKWVVDWMIIASDRVVDQDLFNVAKAYIESSQTLNRLIHTAIHQQTDSIREALKALEIESANVTEAFKDSPTLKSSAEVPQQPHYSEYSTLIPSSDVTEEELSSGACGASHRSVSTNFQIKAISLWQPWASLITLGLKRYETRSWRTNYRGKLLICSTAANSKQHQEYLKICDELQLPPWEDFLHGCAIAICELTDCILMTPEFIALASQTEILCGDWQVGRYAWRLENIQPLPPFEVKGKQGLFNLTLTNTQLELVKPQALDSVAKACDHSNEVLEVEVGSVECDGISDAVGNLDDRKTLNQECEAMESPISSELELNTDPVLDEQQVDSDCAEAIATPSIESFLCPSCEQPLLNLEEGCGVCGWVNSLPEPKEKNNDSSEAGARERCYLPLAEIRRDGGTQPRVAIDLKHIKLLEAQIEEGQELEPVVVFYDGEFYWLADGFHRCAAYQNQQEEDIACIVYPGSVRDAILYSVGTNADHKPALPRSNQDKRRAVRILLEDDEWTKWSDREIAQRCRVGNKFVGDVRRSLCPEHSEKKRTYKTKHGTLAKMETGNIGKKKPASVPEAQGNDTLDLEPDATPQTVDININEIIVAFVSNFKGLNKDQIEGIGNALKLQSPEQAQILVQAIVSEPGLPLDIVTI